MTVPVLVPAPVRRSDGNSPLFGSPSWFGEFGDPLVTSLNCWGSRPLLSIRPRNRESHRETRGHRQTQRTVSTKKKGTKPVRQPAHRADASSRSKRSPARAFGAAPLPFGTRRSYSEGHRCCSGSCSKDWPRGDWVGHGGTPEDGSLWIA